MENKNIYQRINAIMAEESIYIKKGSAGHGTGVLYDEVIAKLQPLLARHGIVVSVDKVGEGRSRQNQKGNYIYECDFNVTYVNIDNPQDRLITLVEAHAMDAGDKAPGKAITYATKVSLLKVFGIESGDNEESRNEQMNFDTINEQQQNQLFTLLCDPTTGQYTPMGLKICNAFKFNNINEIKTKKFEQILKAANQ